jgi:EAL domain-containing protein (putative c-di-GMP-specific phosphodiesterase class I)
MEAEKSTQDIADRLVAALQQDEFVLYSQRIVPLAARGEDWPFQEIFVRFAEEDAKLLPPGSFLPVLEECRLLPYLDRWVVNRLARWVRSGLAIKPDWKVPRSNVNLSRATLLDPDFGTYVRRYVDDSFLSHGVLAFEIAWSDVVPHAESVHRLMKAVKPFGCGFTLAGFDGGKSSYKVLEAVGPDFIKISPAITGDVERDPAHADKVAEISQRCTAMGIHTIAEQVENPQTLEKLGKLQVDFAQGFGIAPVKAL